MDLEARAIYEAPAVIDSLLGGLSLHVQHECGLGTTNVPPDLRHQLHVGLLPWPLFHLDALGVGTVFHDCVEDILRTIKDYL
jgi:hypothetical protein